MRYLDILMHSCVAKLTQLAVGAEFLGSGAATASDGYKKHSFNLPCILAYTADEFTHIRLQYMLCFKYLPLASHSVSLHIFGHWETLCSDDDDKAMLLLLEISHPAFFTDRCHAFMASLNCQHLVKHIEAWWRFYLSCLFSTC